MTDLWLLMCHYLYHATCVLLLLFLFLMCFCKTKGKAQSTIQVGHKLGSYTPNMRGYTHKEIDVQSIHNKRSNSDYRLEKIVRKQSDQDRKLPSWAHSQEWCHSEMCTLCVGSHRCYGGMACGDEVTTMSHRIFLLSFNDWGFNQNLSKRGTVAP